MSCIRKPEDDDAVALRVSTVPATKPELSPIHAANPTAKMAVTGMSSAPTMIPGRKAFQTRCGSVLTTRGERSTEVSSVIKLSSRNGVVRLVPRRRLRTDADQISLSVQTKPARKSARLELFFERHILR